MTSTVTPRAAFGTRTRVGMAIVGLLGVLDCFSLLFTSDPGDGPPLDITILDTVLGVITVVAVAIGWARRRRGALRIAAGARVLSVITALPAFFAGVEPSIVALVAAFVVVTVVGVVLMLSPKRRASTR